MPDPPLDQEGLEDLRWYLEDYLRAPYGVYGERGAGIETRLRDWGKTLFQSLFATGAARDAYLTVMARPRPTA